MFVYQKFIQKVPLTIGGVVSVVEIGEQMFEKEYKQGMTTVWTDGDKLRISNPAGKRHVKANVDHIFGVGEFEKIKDNAYIEEEARSKSNILAIEYLLVSGYIPQRVVDDIKDFEGRKDLTKKYFKGKNEKAKDKNA